MEAIKDGWNELVHLYDELNRTLTWKEIIVFTSVPVASWITYKLFIKPFLSPLRKLPGQPYIPIVGNMFSALKKEAMANAMEWMKAADSKFIRFYFLYGECRLLVADPEIIRYINVTNWQNYQHPDSGAIKSRFPEFILSTKGEKHKSLKKLLNPSLGRIFVDSFSTVFSRLTGEMIEEWDQQIGSQESCIVEAQNYMSRLTLDVICECGFDYKMNALFKPDHVGVQCFRRILLDFRIRLFQMIPVIRKLPFQINIQRKKDKEFFHKTIKTVVDQKKNSLNSQDVKGNVQHKGDLLTLLLQAKDESGKGLPDNIIIDNIGGFLFAGFETTSSSLTWALLNLAENPDIQDKVREEINSVLPSNDKHVSLNELDKLTYLNCCIKESLRLYPVASTYFRQAVNDDVINGYKIPAGTMIGISISGLHRHPDNWKDPERFIPERFLEDYDPHKFLPFSEGPLMCMGKRFAEGEMKTVLAMLIKKFRFSKPLDYKYRRVQNLTVVPDPPLKLIIERI